MDCPDAPLNGGLKSTTPATNALIVGGLSQTLATDCIQSDGLCANPFGLATKRVGYCSPVEIRTVLWRL
jgi:hypothetical protein